MTTSEWQSRVKSLKGHSRPWPPWDLLDYVATEPQSVNGMRQIKRWFTIFNPSWCYRGHGVESWHLHSSLRRERKQVTVENGDRIHVTYPPFDALDHEAYELADFQRSTSEPTSSAQSNELATMQHYGTPTTSLDFSRSPFVALWFAMEGERSEKRNDGSPKGSLHCGLSIWIGSQTSAKQ